MVTFDFALDTVMQLPQVEREDLIEIVRKRQTEEWRKDTADYYKELKKDLNNGNIKPLSATNTINELHNFINSNE
jgi:hypothetical protein